MVSDTVSHRKFITLLTLEKPEAFMNALHRQPDDIKVVIQFADA